MISNINTDNSQAGEPASKNKFIEPFKTSIKKLIVNSVFKGYNSSLIIKSKISFLPNFFKNISGLLIGLILSIVMYSSDAQTILSDYTNLDVVFFTIGGIIGTMTALVLSLSILPIQRASEALSETVIKFYTSDKKSFIIFFLLVLFCVLSFVFGIDFLVKIKIEKLFPIEIIFIATSFDIIR